MAQVFVPVKRNSQHIYIDDGCYGSLSNYPNEGVVPIPLKSQQLANVEVSGTSEIEKEAKMLVISTVWGPTCESLQ